MYQKTWLYFQDHDSPSLNSAKCMNYKPNENSSKFVVLRTWLQFFEVINGLILPT